MIDDLRTEVRFVWKKRIEVTPKSLDPKTAEEGSLACRRFDMPTSGPPDRSDLASYRMRKPSSAHLAHLDPSIEPTESSMYTDRPNHLERAEHHLLKESPTIRGFRSQIVPILAENITPLRHQGKNQRVLKISPTGRIIADVAEGAVPYATAHSFHN